MFIQITTTHEPYHKHGTDVTLNTDQIAYIARDQVFMSNGSNLLVHKEEMKAIMLAVLPKERKKKNDAPNEELKSLFEKLHKLTGGKGKAVFSLQREKKLKDLLGKHRLTKELLIKAATNIGEDDFLQGDNDNNKRYGDIDYLLRPDKAAKWSEEQSNNKKTGMFQ